MRIALYVSMTHRDASDVPTLRPGTSRTSRPPILPVKKSETGLADQRRDADVELVQGQGREYEFYDEFEVFFGDVVE
jgi:hypothetical protein